MASRKARVDCYKSSVCSSGCPASVPVFFKGRGRRRMGSVDSWPLAKLFTEQREVMAMGVFIDPLSRSSSRGSQGHTRSLRRCAVRLGHPLGNLEGGSRSR